MGYAFASPPWATAITKLLSERDFEFREEKLSWLGSRNILSAVMRKLNRYTTPRTTKDKIKEGHLEEENAGFAPSKMNPRKTIRPTHRYEWRK
ncbi:hypothetical protein C943_03504 [Mariniradius saccharolyticus AK6]|uniref:Uncharacterized protein n=1 Tax=Mariniradius saccharolyticus AK6 TaxID=1239962 RepID=M7XA38_9BACT|nr:hypothetical protein C943_03504 [Mariniradius saccharolyticus AK6]